MTVRREDDVIKARAANAPTIALKPVASVTLSQTMNVASPWGGVVPSLLRSIR